ncbi:MAG TPA: GAF domain-containing SpoIIE family protein phosphatase [Trebonia sp.]|jgi:putative methionine-R-sulfoxide reductase with GAF domain|nr:GAF domain-containing SpoIIE family protein phosphatase [Trebonia sp.]
MTDDPAQDVADRLRDIEAVTDAALSRLGDRELLNTLLDRVKKVLAADTAAVLLLDRSSRQLVATAASGLEEEVRQGVRIPLGVGFAGRIAASAKPVILNRVDHSTVRNPLLVDRGIKSLLGVPLFADGEVIGVLHVGSVTGRSFGTDDAELLQLASERASRAVHSLMAREAVEAALALQVGLLPSELPDVPGFDLSARYVAGSGTVGGDWYDVFVLPDGRLGFVVGDVAGSGLPAAVIMGRMRSALRAYVLETSDPAVALAKLDRKMQYFEADSMATVLYGLLDPETGTLEISSAGHPPPVIAAADGTAGPIPLRPDPPIGVAAALTRRSDRFPLPEGALMCCYTDGLVERRGVSIDEGIGQVAATLAATMAQWRVSGARQQDGLGPVPLAEDACGAVMKALVGSTSARDDIGLLMLHRHG